MLQVMRTHNGFTLVELIIYIVILAIGSVSILTAIQTWDSKSSDHLIQKQAINIAESIMDEVNAMPFTLCDPQDFNVLTALTYSDCTIPQSGLGPAPSTESRGDALDPYDNLFDYHNWSMTGISYIDNTSIPELANYNSNVFLTPVTISGNAGYLIRVTVTPPTGIPVVLESFRSMHSPRRP